ncbi:MAG: penicillin-binding protein [Clostridia bacterium]|nr:penicillin-binding protein [Clostridia bacterium]
MEKERKYKADIKRNKWKKRIVTIPLIVLALIVLVAVSMFSYVYYHMDYTADETLFSLARGSHTTRFYYHDPNAVRDGGEPFSRDALNKLLPGGYRPVEWETQRIHGGADSLWCAYDDIPHAMKDAFVAIEDKRFFQHEGVDWLRTSKAALNYMLHFDGRFGGSTITQQLIKNISSDDDISISRKLREICRALHLEGTHSKEEILELYLNIVPLSQGCVGVGAAAELYFGKSIHELSTAECAAIAAITNSPVKFDPYTEKENNRARRDLILREMHAGGMLNQAAYESAIAEETVLQPLPEKREPVYDWYVETVISDVIRDLMTEKGLSRDAAEKLVYGGGLQIYTQMNMDVQKTLKTFFEDETNFPSACRNGLSYAMVVCDPYTGDLLGIVSSVGEKTQNRVLNYASDVLRAPGSALKPLSVYAPAVQENLINWATVTDDVPIRFVKSANGYTAWPHNSPQIYSGLTDIKDALAYSKNTVAVRVYEALGAEKSYGYLQRLGMDTLVRQRKTQNGSITDLAAAPLALGQLSDGVSVRALTNAYGALANGGDYHPSRSYSLVLDGSGRPLLKKQAAGERIFSRESASIMTELLQGVTSYGTAKTLKLTNFVDVAGKTGTSSENRDKWFVGYTPYYTAGIWCGYADGSTAVADSLSKTHLAVWDTIMRQLHQSDLSCGQHARSFTPATGVVARAYCKDSGLLPCEACRKDPRGNRITMGYFKAGTEPRSICNCHVTVRYDLEGGGLARGGCPEENVKEIGMLCLPSRLFPVEVYVSDAQYGYRDLGAAKPSDEMTQPFYAGLLASGEHIGLSHTSDGKQFNSMCPLHGNEPTQEYEDLPDEGESKNPFDWFTKHFLSRKR